MKGKSIKRLLSIVMAFAMLIAFAGPASAAELSEETTPITIEKVDNSAVSNPLSENREVPEETSEVEPIYADTDMVRVSIILEDPSTIEAGYSTADIASNRSAMAYRAGLESEQQSVTSEIEDVTGDSLDVVWNLTLAANIISANVEYGQIEEIKETPGVADVLLETYYEPAVVDVDPVADPTMSTSSSMIGSSAAYLEGYTGAGSRIAIIDTGTDTDHQSFDAGAYEYALSQLAEEAGMSYEDYVASLDLLDANEIASVASELNATVDPETAYLTSKLPYAYNYVDGDYDITHDNDSQGEHGSHVAGIATANSYIPDGEGGYESALDSVYVQGVAPEAQLITMKVFGKGGGAYDSDYMAAIEDAIVLGADAVNLSLGSASAGMTYSATAEYQSIMENLTNTDTVVTMSAGNAGAWADSAVGGSLYSDEVNFDTVGSPGSFTNSLSVASADNTGATGNYVSVDGENIVYTETTGYANQPMTTLVGEQSYVLFDIDRAGQEAIDFAAYADALTGKIVVCYRGTSSFYEKGNAAVANGAIGVMVANNTTGTINMDLTGYNGPAPCVSITQAAGETLKNAAEAVTDAEGNVLYYVGTMTVSDTIGTANDPDADVTMSDFSSWGVPGSLELKPEITAPGGNIYSVNGLPADGTAYEQMSGTSMAAPQVAGMAALVAQYIQENDLEDQTGLSNRQLTNSLLMSTAVPLYEPGSSNYYSILNQGAGLANVGDAVKASSYIMMGANATDSYADGKVKAELGDDPEKAGTYSFSFTINNLNGEEELYALSADLFTQAVSTGEDGFDYLSDSTTNLAFGASWTVDGQPVDLTGAEKSLNGMDFNDDGQVNAGDGQALLDYATGARDSIANEGLADLNEDGLVNSYDAYLFFKTASTGYVSVPADGSVTISVTLSLTDEQKAALAESNPAGAYIEGFVYATAATSEEGVLGTSHSIPVLGYYGSWTDPSMYDVGTWTYNSNAEAVEADVRPSHLGSSYSNYVTINYTGVSGAYYFGGNPMYAEAYDETRNAMNADDTLNAAYYALIRNAAGGKLTITNTTTGEVELEQEIGQSYGAYFHENAGAWYNTSANRSLGFSPAGAEGDQYVLSLTMAPEYYLTADGTIDYEAIGEGATLSIPFTIDNTAPEVEEFSSSNIFVGDEGLTFTVQENQYIAGAALYDSTGSEVFWDAPGEQTEVGEEQTFTIGTDTLEDGIYLLQICDYANNAATYRMFVGIEAATEVTDITLSNDTLTMMKGTTALLTATVAPENIIDNSVTWETSDDTVATVDENGVVTAVDVGECTITATSVQDPEMSATCTVIVEVPTVTLTGALQDADGNPHLFTWNMETDNTWTAGAALDNDINSVAQDMLYGDVYQQNTAGYMYRIDPVTGETLDTSAAAVAYGAPMQDLAIASVSGTAFGVYGSYLLYSDDPMANTFNMGWSMGIYMLFYSGGSKFVAATWGGLDITDEGQYVDVIYALDDAGTLWVFEYDGGDSINFGYISTDLDLAFPTYGGTQFCSMVWEPDTDAFYLSYFTGSTNEIYMLEYNTSTRTFEATLLGNVGDDVWPAALISAENNGSAGNTSTDITGYVSTIADAVDTVATVKADIGTTPDAEETTPAETVPETTPAETVPETTPEETVPETTPAETLPEESTAAETAPEETLPEETPEETLPEETMPEETTAPATETEPVNPAPAGGLNSTVVISGGNAKTTEEAGTVTVEVTEDVASTNGVVKIAYDPDELQLENVSIGGNYTSQVVDEENGSVTVGYVSLNGIEAGAPVATLKFKAAITCADETTVSILHEEVNDTTPDAVECESVSPAHSYGEPVITWSDDKSSCEMTFTCEVCGDVQTVEANVTSVTTPATATTDGQIVYTATVTFNGQTYTSTQTVVLPATGSGNTGNQGGSGSQGCVSTGGQPSQTGGNQTGDNSPIVLLIIVAAAAAVVVFFGLKRRGQKA